MKILIIFILFTFYSTAFAFKKSVSIDVSLSPAGSFQIHSKRIKGKAHIKDNQFSASNLKIPIKSLKTGIDLRDHHLKKKLGIEQNKKAVLLLVSASGKNGTGKATFEVLNKQQTVSFTYKKLSDKFGSANFDLSLKAFGIKGISYMGIGVDDIVKVKILCPYKSK